MERVLAAARRAGRDLPKRARHHHRKEGPWSRDAHLGGGRAAQIAREQDRTENRGTRNHKEDHTDQFGDPNSENQSCGISKPGGCLDCRSQLHHFQATVKKQEQNYQGANDAAGPHPFLRDGNGLSCRLHEFFPHMSFY